MYPIKNLFTGKEIGQFAFENGQIQITGDFPLKEEIRKLAENASQIRGERFEGGIRDEQVPLDPKTDLELVANFVNSNISDRSIQIINYDDSPEEDDITEDADKALQECVSTKIPIFKKEHPDWTEEHVQAAAFGYCREKLGMKDTAPLPKEILDGIKKAVKMWLENDGGYEEKTDEYDEKFDEKFDEITNIISSLYGKKIDVYRAMSVENPKKVGMDILEKEKYEGGYWAYDSSGAESYEGDMTANLELEGEVDTEDVDWEDTAYHNLSYPEEMELRLKKAENHTTMVKVTSFRYGRAGEPENWKYIQKEKTESSKSGEVHVSAHTREGGDVKVSEHTRSLPSKDQQFADKAITWTSSFGTKVVIRSLDDVNAQFSELNEESEQEAQELLDYFSVVKNWLLLYKTLYHGSNVPPERILKQGLDDETFLTPDIDIAKNYGEYIYEVNLEKVPPETMLGPAWEGETREMRIFGTTKPNAITLSEEKGIEGSGTTKGKAIAEEVKSSGGEVHVSAHTREGGDVKVQEHTRSMPSRDQQFTLLKDATVIGNGTIFHDGTCVFHSPDAAELYGCVESLLKIHSGRIELMDEQTERGKEQDKRKTAKTVYPTKTEAWVNDPAHSDVQGVDTAGGLANPSPEDWESMEEKKESNPEMETLGKLYQRFMGEINKGSPDYKPSEWRGEKELEKPSYMTSWWRSQSKEKQISPEERQTIERWVNKLETREKEITEEGTRKYEAELAIPPKNAYEAIDKWAKKLAHFYNKGKKYALNPFEFEHEAMQEGRVVLEQPEQIIETREKSVKTDRGFYPKSAVTIKGNKIESVKIWKYLESHEEELDRPDLGGWKLGFSKHKPESIILPTGENVIKNFEQRKKEKGWKDSAFIDCPRRKALLEDATLIGFTSPYGYIDHTAEIVNTREMRGVTIADVIMAREMVQTYHVTELPFWLRDQFPNKEFIRVFKSYEELDKGFSPVSEGPATQFHVDDSFPAMDSPVVLSSVKNIHPDPKCRCIKGRIYFVEKNWPAAVMDSIQKGEITAVSIGGSTEFGPGGIFNGQIYDLAQKNIKFGHLAVLPGAEGRCPKGLCGVNLKDSKNSQVGFENESNSERVTGHFNKLNFTSPSFSQSMFVIADSLNSVIDIKRSNQIEGNTLLTEESTIMPDNEIVQKLQDALAAKNQELLKLTSELSAFKDSATAKKVKELEVESNAVKDQYAALQKENAKLKDDAAKLEVRVKDADTFRHSMYDRALLSTPFYKGKEKELAAMPLDEKAIVFRTAQNLGAVQLADAAILQDGFPKPPEGDRQKFMDSGGNARTKMPSPEIEVPKGG